MFHRFFLLFLLLLSALAAVTHHRCKGPVTTVHFQPLTEKALQEWPLDFRRDIETFDPGFLKWIPWMQGFPRETPIDVYQERPLFSKLLGTNATLLLNTVIFKEDQRLYGWASGQPTEELISVRGFLLGERVYYRFVGRNCKFLYETSIVLRPIVGLGQSRCRLLWAELNDVNCSTYTLYVTVDPGQTYELVIQNGRETSASKHKGPLTTNLCPSLSGCKEGVAQVTIVLDGDSATLALPWGEALFPYIKGVY